MANLAEEIARKEEVIFELWASMASAREIVQSAMEPPKVETSIQQGQGETLALFGDEPAPGRSQLVLRPYQGEAVDSVMAGFLKDRRPRQIGVAATGAGKTAMFVEIARRFHEKGGLRTLILTDQLDLISQTVEAVARFTGLMADVEQGENRASHAAPVVVASVKTIEAHLDEWPAGHFALVVADECDRALSATWEAVLAHFQNSREPKALGNTSAFVLGVTATPKRTDRRSVLRAFEHMAFQIPLLKLVKEKWLATITPKTVDLPIDLRSVKKTAGDYDPAQVAAALGQVFDGVVASLKEHAPDRRIIVFLPLVETSKAFMAACHRGGLTADHIDGSFSLEKRRAVKQAFKDRRFQVMCNPCLLGRGYDAPWIDCVVNLRATMSEALFFQIVGRGLRLYCPHGCNGQCDHPEAKRDLLLLDYLWQVEGHGLMRPAHLVAETPEEAAAITKLYADRGSKQPALDLMEAKPLAAAAAEKALIEKFLTGRSMYKVPIKADVWAAKLGLSQWVGWEPETDAQDTPITQSQAKKLQEKGFQLETVKGGFHASFILGRIDEQRKAGKASFKQVWWLWQRKYHDAHEWSNADASAMLSELFGNKE